MKENLVHARTCVYNINYHVVWSVKYRRKILSPEIEEYLKGNECGRKQTSCADQLARAVRRAYDETRQG